MTKEINEKAGAEDFSNSVKLWYRLQQWEGIDREGTSFLRFNQLIENSRVNTQKLLKSSDTSFLHDLNGIIGEHSNFLPYAGVTEKGSGS